MIRQSDIDIFSIDTSQAPEVPPVESRYAFKHLDLAKLSACRLSHEKNRLATFAGRLAERHCAVGYVDRSNSVVSYLWATAPRHGTSSAPFEQALRILIPADTVYIWDCRTDPDHRRKGLYRAGLVETVHWAASIGASAACIVTEVTNTASSDAMISAGFEKRCQLSLRRLGPLTVARGPRGCKLRLAGGSIMLEDLA